jgi:hypothetical protein
MDAVSGGSQGDERRVRLTDYQRYCRLVALEREHVRLMRGWTHPHNTAYAVAHGFDYSPQYGCYLRGRR